MRLFFNIPNLLQSVQWRFFLLFGSLAIVILSIFYTLSLAGQLKEEERKRMELLGEAQKSMMDADPNCDVTFQSKILESNTTVPSIVADGDYRIQYVSNYGKEYEEDRAFFERELTYLKANTTPIIIEAKEFPIKLFIFHRQSTLITYLAWFPPIQFGLLFLFILLAYLSFSAIRKSQQERIWVGMAKETAHQLGTPITSLVGWIENIKDMYPADDNLLMMASEMYRDVELLEIVAGRFSKIGAKPELHPINLYERLERHHHYISQRAPRKVSFHFPDFQNVAPLTVYVNNLLFDWVVENLLKNALDAMGGKGSIKIEVLETEKSVFIDVSDTGKGMPKSLFKKIFKPGFSTKKRGWGLGLSLCKRIVENYHNGKIFVKQSVINQGTTFRIQLPKKVRNKVDAIV